MISCALRQQGTQSHSCRSARQCAWRGSWPGAALAQVARHSPPPSLLMQWPNFVVLCGWVVFYRVAFFLTLKYKEWRSK
jgi:hypothetical protein